MGAPLSRSDRIASLKPRAVAEFGKDEATAALHVLTLMDYAWHDCYREAPPEQVLDDVFVYARGSLARLAYAARTGVEDFRDLRLAADDVRRA